MPSSRFLVDRVLSQIDWTRARVVVEYGPGVGTVTTGILNRMMPNAALVAIEIDRSFVEVLCEHYRDPRLHVVKGSAANVRAILSQLGFASADYIISGIPFTTIPEHARVAVMRESRAALSRDGAMIVYQFTRAVLPYLRREFGSVREDFEPLNILPAQLFTCSNRAPVCG